MKYVITGASGNTGRPIAEALLAKGHEVVVVSRNAEHVNDLKEKGAEVAEGNVEDRLFLKDVFAGADAVYSMVPPNWNPVNWKNWIGSIGDNFAAALRDSSVKKVVNLSSIGADLSDAVGPVSGLYRVEQALNGLNNIDVLHLRAGYFYQNLLANIPMIKDAHILGGNMGDELYLVDPSDIAAAATHALLENDFTGKVVRYVISDHQKTDAIAKSIGEKINEPALPWIQFSDEDSLQGMLQAGLPPEIAKNYVEMGAALRTGIATADLKKQQPSQNGAIKLADFARQFADAYYQ